jgi:hypothetical protein
MKFCRSWEQAREERFSTIGQPNRIIPERKSDHDAANNGGDKNERGGTQRNVDRSVDLVPRRGSTLRSIEPVHMRIRHTQIRHVLPPLIFYCRRDKPMPDIYTVSIN